LACLGVAEPSERNVWRALLAWDRLRIEAWMSFQNQYLASVHGIAP